MSYLYNILTSLTISAIYTYFLNFQPFLSTYSDILFSELFLKIHLQSSLQSLLSTLGELEEQVLVNVFGGFCLIYLKMMLESQLNHLHSNSFLLIQCLHLC